MRLVFFMLLLLLGAQALPASGDEFRVMKLEQDMRNLEQQVRELQRQLASFQQHDSGPPSQSAARAERGAAAAPTSTSWLEARNWDRIRLGMSELEVIDVLGPPTSMRTSDDAKSRTLFYAMEIGSSGFLGGNVRFQERKVVEIQKPVLR